MRLPGRNVRLALGLGFITVAAAAAQLAATWLLSVRASFPQQPLMAAAIPFLDRGDDPAVVLPSRTVEVDSGSVWMTVTDRSGAILASSAEDAGQPVSLASCRQDGAPAENCFFVPDGNPLPRHLTVELPTGSRQAVLVGQWHAGDQGGYVFIGRSRELLDEKWAFLTRLIAATWLAGLGAFLFVNRAVSRK